MDLSYSDEDGFENYIPTTTDPGPWLFGGTALYSVGCFVMIPILVTIKKKSGNKRNSARLRSSSEGTEENNGSPPALLGCVDLEIRPTKSTDDDVDCDEFVIQLNGSNDEPLQASHSRTGRMAMDAETPSKLMSESSAAAEIENDAQNLSSAEPTNSKLFQMSIDDGGSSNLQGREEKAEIAEDRENATILLKQVDNVEDPFALEDHSDVNEVAAMQDSRINNTPIQALEQSDQHPCCANVFGCKTQKFISSSKDIVEYDKETKRILRLAGPFVMSEVSEVLFEALTVLLVSRYTDVNQLSAYIVTDLLIGTSETIIKGLIETLETVCPHAIGVENNKLAGQYVQIVLILYSICSVPIFGMWWFVMEGALEWFELSESAINIGVEYSKLLIFNYYLDGIFKAFVAIPDVTDREKETKIYQVCHDALEFALIWILLARFEWFDLFWVGVVQLCSTFVGFSAFVIATVKLGWFDPYWEGLTKNLALRKKSAVMYVIKMAAPLSIGSLFEYGEWELLTIFAASMGQAEVAAWGLMESIWDLLEAFIEGFSNAGSVRLALHLGKGNIVQAKRSAWKSLFLVTTLGLVISIIYAIIGDHIAVLFTSDETLQNMLKAMIPIICFGNVFQSFGSMAWCLVGSQGRYHHATLISTTVTITVSIPLAAFFSLGMHFSLESLIAALVIGYSTISMCLSYLLVTSDWAYISKKVIEENEDNDSSDGSSSSSNASSASDDEPCDNAVGDFPELVLESDILASSSIALSASNVDRGDFSVSRDSEQVPDSFNMQGENMSSSSLRSALSSSSSSSTTSRSNVDCRAQTNEDDEIILSLAVDAIYPTSKEYSATPSSSNSDCKDPGATRIIPAISGVTDEKEKPGGLSSPFIPSSNSDLSSNLFSVGVVMEDEAGKAEVSNSSAPFVHNSKEAEGTADSNSSSRSLVEGNGDDRINLIDQMLVQNWA
mmetsp:Transcript_24231/g.50641  ORF Transcript_24231/g.50641 Transcript_24231/m.50641 type:complete len:952 (+) Transcript_24231:90-2945(+)